MNFDEGIMESKGSTDLHIGSLVERIVEDMWFTGRVVKLDDSNQECSISYIDDDWEETNVPYGDIRLLNGDCKLSLEKVGRQSKLPKPLLGLIDDDCEKRSAHEPTVEVHRDSNTDKEIIINGSEKKLAVGGGVRALRYLKH